MSSRERIKMSVGIFRRAPRLFTEELEQRRVLSATAVDDGGEAFTIDENQVLESVTLPSDVILPFGSTWSYLDDGSDLGIEWTTVAFDDSAWSTGPAELGYGEDDEATVISFGPDETGKFITSYFRSTFSITDIVSTQPVSFAMEVDDGALIWINGTEVIRHNMEGAVGDGMVTSTTFGGIPSGTAITGDGSVERVLIPSSQFQEGINTIAVEVHQAAFDSSDLSFDLQIERGGNSPILANDELSGLMGVPSVTLVGQPIDSTTSEPAGTVTMDAIGNFTFTPNDYYAGTATFYYQLSDSSDPEDIPSIATVTLTVNPVESPPTAVTDVYSTVEGSPLTTVATLNTFVGLGSTWSFLGDGSDQETAWTAVDFDDSLWERGPAELGYGDGDEVTVTPFVDTDDVTEGDQVNATTYFRSADFDIAGADSLTTLNMSLKADDSAAVYLNGTEIYRTSNLDPAAAFDTYADADGNPEGIPAWEVTVDVASTGVMLTETGNVLAVEVHQRSPGSSDISFDLMLFEGIEGVLANDRDPEGNSISVVQVVREPSGGSVEMNSDGSFTYTPNPDFTGTDYFEYEVQDDVNPTLTSTGIVQVGVVNSQDEPIANNDIYTVASDDVLDTVLFYRSLDAADKTILQATGDTWRYQDDGSDLGTAWKDVEFDPDNPSVGVAWRSGVAILGYGNGNEVTKVRFGPDENNANNDPEQKYITYYFRKTFPTPEGVISASVDKLILSVTRDDGVAVYLNGTEVLRDGLSAGAGFEDAAVHVFNDGIDPLELAIDANLLNSAGGAENVIAVEIHQSARTSSDIAFDLELAIPNATAAIGVMFNDVDLDNDTLLASLVPDTGPSHAESFTLNADGTFSYDPQDTFAGRDQFTYQIDDGNGGISTASVIINVGVVTSLPGDFDDSEIVDIVDIDLLYGELGNTVPPTDVKFDLVDDGIINADDVTHLVESILGTQYGDTNLDCDIDTGDLTTSIINFTSADGTGKGFAQGDNDGDGDVDTGDLTKSIINFTGAGTGCSAELHTESLGQGFVVIQEEDQNFHSSGDRHFVDQIVRSDDVGNGAIVNSSSNQLQPTDGDRTHGSGRGVKRSTDLESLDD